MPIFTFLCQDCRKTFDILCSVAGEIRPFDKCPHCGGRNITKKPTAANIIFRGEGWTEKG